MNKYTELRDKIAKQVSEFPMAFAFNDKQLAEAKQKLEVADHKELVHVGGGCLIRRIDKPAFNAMHEATKTERAEAMLDDDYLYDGFLYELGNHEYCITYDPTDTLDCFDLTLAELNKDARMLEIFKRARKQYMIDAESFM